MRGFVTQLFSQATPTASVPEYRSLRPLGWNENVCPIELSVEGKKVMNITVISSETLCIWSPIHQTPQSRHLLTSASVSHIFESYPTSAVLVHVAYLEINKSYLNEP